MKHPERPPVIEASEKTAFIYRIEGGMDDRDMDEMEAMDSGYVLGRNWPTIVSESVDIGHRMRYMRKRGLGFRFLRMEDRAFEDTLRSYDPDMPEILAWMLTLNPSACCAIIWPFVTISPVFTIACAGAPICWLKRILTLDTGTTFSSIGASLSYLVSPRRAIRRSTGTLRYSREGCTGTGCTP